MPFQINEAGVHKLVKELTESELVARMQRVADACNEEAGLTDGYRVGIEGTHTLQKHDQRMTVITATAEAIAYDRKHNALIRNFHLAGGE